jgi:GntR family transcriptional regulator
VTTTVPRHLSYRGIADDLAARIELGEYPRGTTLPSYKQLSEIYGVSVATIARAISLLHDRDLVYGEPGRGVFVAD